MTYHSERNMTRTRLETNFTRLLDQCKSMANNGKHANWRFEKFVATLEEQLSELRTSPMTPEKEIMDEYFRSVAFLKGLIITEKQPNATDRVVASQFLSPSSTFGDEVYKEIRHKVAARYVSQVREELMASKPGTAATNNLNVSEDKNKEFENPITTLRQRKVELLDHTTVTNNLNASEDKNKEFGNPTSTLRQRKAELLDGTAATSNFIMSEEKNKDCENSTSTSRQRKAEHLGTMNNSMPVSEFNTVISDEQQSQEQITMELLTLTKTLKEQSMSANAIINKDFLILEKSNSLAEDHQDTLQTQTQKLQERSGFCRRCWVWLFLLLVCISFISMVVFMRLFKKKKLS